MCTMLVFYSNIILALIFAVSVGKCKCIMWHLFDPNIIPALIFDVSVGKLKCIMWHLFDPLL